MERPSAPNLPIEHGQSLPVAHLGIPRIRLLDLPVYVRADLNADLIPIGGGHAASRGSEVVSSGERSSRGSPIKWAGHKFAPDRRHGRLRGPASGAVSHRQWLSGGASAVTNFG